MSSVSSASFRAGPEANLQPGCSSPVYSFSSGSCYAGFLKILKLKSFLKIMFARPHWIREPHANVRRLLIYGVLGELLGAARGI